MSEEPEFLTIPETARLLRINRGRAYAMAGEGTLPGVVRLGRTIRVNRAELIAGLIKSAQNSEPTSLRLQNHLR